MSRESRIEKSDRARSRRKTIRQIRKKLLKRLQQSGLLLFLVEVKTDFGRKESLQKITYALTRYSLIAIRIRFL